MQKNKFMENTIMKTKEELNAIKEEFEALNKKLAELTDEELKLVTGGATEFENKDDINNQEIHIYKDETNRNFRPGF